MLSIGDGIGLVGVVASIALAFFKVKQLGKGENGNGNSNSNGKYVLTAICQVQHTETNRRLERIEKKLDELLESR